MDEAKKKIMEEIMIDRMEQRKAYIQRLLDNQNTIELVWHESIMAIDSHGNETIVGITVQAFVVDCIGIARLNAIRSGALNPSDTELLSNFISGYWASEVKK